MGTPQNSGPSMATTGLYGVILAAGQSTRMGRDKALLPWPKASQNQEGTLLSAAISCFRNHCDLVFVIAGTNAENVRGTVYRNGADILVNPDPDRGQFSSLRIGLQEVLNRGRDGAMVTLVDRPPLRADTLAVVVEAFRNRSNNIWAVIPEFAGKHGHPIVIGREMIEAFLRAPANSNAREVEHAHQPHVRYVPVNDSLVITNVDTPQDYASLESE